MKNKELNQNDIFHDKSLMASVNARMEDARNRFNFIDEKNEFLFQIGILDQNPTEELYE